MRLAIVSDIHGNMDAFEQVLADITRSDVDEIISLGDNIGYGPEPDLVVKNVQACNIPSVVGNHELAVVQPKYLSWFNPVARESLLKTIKLLSDQSVRYISKQESHLVSFGCRFVHGFPPDSALIYMFQVSDSRKKQIFDKLNERICFIGHTHILEMISYDGKKVQYNPLNQGINRLSDEKKYILNVGSVGQPRDGDNRAKYVIWNSLQGTIEVKCVPYDIAATVEKIRAAGLPEEHAQRLW
ncbi:MAG: metallophosphoesterase family protein [Desulfobacterales bacterium]|nr:MAG: metallophosphoesterase family protein [Desulfobacterales bacterium]